MNVISDVGRELGTGCGGSGVKDEVLHRADGEGKGSRNEGRSRRYRHKGVGHSAPPRTTEETPVDRSGNRE